MVFCNLINNEPFCDRQGCHNPYFNRWFSAIIDKGRTMKVQLNCHNPYFNRWFSAIIKISNYADRRDKSQSLF